MKGKYLKGKTIEFDGTQLVPLWACANADITGDAIVAFRGPCDVPPERMPDVLIRRKGMSLEAPDMIHFIVEYFGCSLEGALMLRRILAAVAADVIRDATEEPEVERDNDDLFVYMPDEDERRRLSVSSATASSISGLVHLGMNASVASGPAGAAGLVEMGVEDIDGFVVEVLRLFIDEVKDIKTAAGRTMPVL